MAKSNSILWFRKGLRLHDNPALLEAIDGAEHSYPIFILDPWFLTPDRVGATRIRFLLESLQDLSNSLDARGSKLILLQGKPNEVLPKIIEDWGISKLCFEADTEPYAKARDAKVEEMANELGVKICSPTSHTLYDPEALVTKNGGSAPLTMTSFQKLIGKMKSPPMPCSDPPSNMPGPDSHAPKHPSTLDKVPSLKDLGYPDIPDGQGSPFRGGETEALARLADYLADKKWVCEFEKPKGDPTAFRRPATTVLSPYLKFGCLSVRLFHAQLVEIYSGAKKHTAPPVSLEGQLLWREFFYTIGATSPNFDRMEGNPICRQIPWEMDEERFKAWQEARTGYPWIDAIMVQLKQWGWMHHLARHCVACFLTRGDLWVPWEAGRDVFDRDLIDADWSINNGNWMWLSASAFFSQYFRVYGPVSFPKKYDKNGDFVRHFLPVLKDMPAKYIYEPWTAPMEVQRAAKCIIGKDYPEPIVDHGTIHKENIARMKKAYDADKARREAEAEEAAGPPAKKARK